jgi:hypothetical protein
LFPPCVDLAVEGEIIATSTNMTAARRAMAGRLADEYDAAQETRKEIHEARTIRDAEASDPIVKRTVDAALAAGTSPAPA